MMAPSPQEVTRLLLEWGKGDQAALDKLMPLIYAELKVMAKRYMSREDPAHTLQTTALINETYLRLVEQPERRWQNRAHFFGVAAQVMRHILVDYARARHNLKRGGEAQVISLDEAAAVSRGQAAELVALDDALTALAALDRRQAQVVELRYFGGLSVEETAEILKVSPDTVRRDWRLAKMWLLRELSI